MEETVRKVSAIFDKMASVKITPTSNYSVPEYWMNRAIKGDEKCKDTLFNWISSILNIDKSILNAVFNAKYNKTNENKVMNRKLIRLTESDLHKIVKESAKRIMKEVALKGKSGKTYSLHGTDPESWAVMSRVRGKNGYFPNTPQHYHACRDEDNWIELDDKAHPNLRSRNNANRINAMMNRIDDKSKDIMAANESKLSRIVKESVNRVLTELDWKTYANAARKRALQGADDKVIGDLDAAANKGLEKYDIGSEQPLYGYKNAPRLKTTKQDSWGNKFARQELKMPEHERYSDNYSAYDHGTGFDGTADISLSKIGGNRDARKDIGDYFRGNSKYIKGQGWQ